MANRTWWTVLAGVFAAAVASSACGGGDDDTGMGGSSGGGADSGGGGTGGSGTGGSGGGQGGTAGAPGTGGASGAPGADPCAVHCAAAAMLHCEGDPPDCEAACQALRETREMACTTEAQAYYACLSNTEVADYYCNDLYVTALRTDECLEQEDALFACTG